jgi:NAD(P)H-flavin reductase
VTVVPVLSKPAADWMGKVGHIQDTLKADGVEVPRNTGVLLCGQKGMVDDSKEILLSEGCFEGRILYNF